MKRLTLGPAAMVTAAFVGPGTLVTATIAGANFGHSLLWALIFAVFASVILQEMCARLGVITGAGLGDNIYRVFEQKSARMGAQILVVSAIVIGNAAYQGGNLSGAALGLSQIAGTAPDILGLNLWPLLIAGIAFVILWQGHYLWLEKSLTVLVAIMSLCFITTFLMTESNWAAFFSGALIPSIPTGATLTVIALIGTTVVPYNLFLHSSSVAIRWQKPEDLKLARQDVYLAIPLGGLISIAIVSVAATAWFGHKVSISSAADLSSGLEPLFGSWASLLTALGLFSAGISSALTAPVAAAFALKGVLKLEGDLKSPVYRTVWLSILLLGTLLSSSGFKPTSIILFAQIANGVLLPVLVIFLLWVMNSKVMGLYQNSKWQNSLGFMVLLVTLILSGKSLISAWQSLFG